MLDHTTRRNRPALSTDVAQQAPQTEQLAVEQIMQPFMGNRDWAQLVAPRVEEPQEEETSCFGFSSGMIAAAPMEPSWLPEGGYETSAFLSGFAG